MFRLRRLAKAKLFLTLACLAVFAVLFTLSLAKYRAFNHVSFDMGRIMESLWNTMRGDPLLMTSKGIAVSRLSEHVELIFLLLAPLYRLAPSGVLLLALQAGLFVLGAFPVYGLAQRRLQSSGPALALAAIYLFYPVAQTAVLFEFHADTLAMPLLLFALDAADRRCWRSAALFMALAFACKVYVAIPVSILGAVHFLQGRRRLGFLTGLAAFAWFLLAFVVIRAAFAPPEAAQVKATAGSYLAFYFGQMDAVIAGWPVRLISGMIAVLPALLLGLRGLLWLLPAAAIYIPVLLSSGPGPVYAYYFHHYALAVPFLIMAMIEGAARLRQAQEAVSTKSGRAAPWRRAVFFSLVLTLLLNAFAVDGPLNPLFYFPGEANGRGLSPSGYVRTVRDEIREDWLKEVVGQKDRVAADNLMGQRLVNRPILYLTHPIFGTFEDVWPAVNDVAVDALYDYVLGDEERILSGGVATEYDTIALVLQNDEWQLHNARDGLLLFSRQPGGLRQEAQRLEPDPAPQLLAKFGDRIGLLSSELTPLGSHRFRLTCEWVALQDLTQLPPFIAVSRPEGLPFSRIVHLPTIGLQPTTTWTAGTVVRESFEFELPSDVSPGSYPLYVGWYRTDGIYSHYTDERTRLGAEVLLSEIELD